MLRHGPLGAEAVHLAVDMQRMFAVGGDWSVPEIGAIVPNIRAIAARRPERTIFTRFLVPPTPMHASGAWQRYYRHWTGYDAKTLPAGSMDLIDELAHFVPPARVVDKVVYSAFGTADLRNVLRSCGATSLIVTGIETDVCVLGTALQAVDLGYRVIVVADALASSSAAGHAATLDHVFPRYDQQIEIVDTATIMASWK